MSSSDVLEQIRASRPVAPTALRERVRALAAEQPAAARPSLVDRLRTRPRKSFLVAAPAFALLLVVTAGAIGLARSGGGGPTAATLEAQREPAPLPAQGAATRAQEDSAGSAGSATTPSTSAGKATLAPRAAAPNPGRLERYQAFLRLRVDDADALSDAQQQAVRLTRSLGGYVVSLQSDVPDRGTGGADLVVRVPRLRVQEAVAKVPMDTIRAEWRKAIGVP